MQAPGRCGRAFAARPGSRAQPQPCLWPGARRRPGSAPVRERASEGTSRGPTRPHTRPTCLCTLPRRRQLLGRPSVPPDLRGRVADRHGHLPTRGKRPGVVVAAALRRPLVSPVVEVTRARPRLQVCSGLAEPNLDGVYCQCPRAAAGDDVCGSCTPNIAYGTWPTCTLCPANSAVLGGSPCGVCVTGAGVSVTGRVHAHCRRTHCVRPTCRCRCSGTGRGRCDPVSGCICNIGFTQPQTGCK